MYIVSFVIIILVFCNSSKTLKVASMLFVRPALIFFFRAVYNSAPHIQADTIYSRKTTMFFI